MPLLLLYSLLDCNILLHFLDFNYPQNLFLLSIYYKLCVFSAVIINHAVQVLRAISQPNTPCGVVTKLC